MVEKQKQQEMAAGNLTEHCVVVKKILEKSRKLNRNNLLKNHFVALSGHTPSIPALGETELRGFQSSGPTWSE